MEQKNREQNFQPTLYTFKKLNNEISINILKDIIKEALGERFTDGQVETALEKIGIPTSGSIEMAKFCAKLASPNAHLIKNMNEEHLGSWLTLKEWQNVLKKLGVDLTLEETEKIIQKTKQKTIDDVARERLALEKIGIDLTKDDILKIIQDAQKAADSLTSSEDSEYETEEEIVL